MHFFDQSNRREAITLLGGAAAWPLAAHSQQSERMGRIGVLMSTEEDEVALGRVPSKPCSNSGFLNSDAAFRQPSRPDSSLCLP
jgi:hypothetical protein